MTIEEELLYELGNVTLFDDLDGFIREKSDLTRWVRERKLAVKLVLETINGQIAVVCE